MAVEKKDAVKAVETKAAAPKAEPAKAAVKAEAPKAEAAKAPVKETVKKAAAPKAAAKTTEKKPAVKKEAAPKKETVKKAPAKKADPTATVVIEYAGKQIVAKDVLAAATKAFKAANKGVEIKTIEIYVQPEENVAYYVVNGEGSNDYKVIL